MTSDEDYNPSQAELERYASHFEIILQNWSLQREHIKRQDSQIKKLTEQVAQLSVKQVPIFRFDNN